MSNGGRIKCGKPSVSLCFISLLNGGLPNNRDLCSEFSGGGGVGFGVGGMIGTGHPGIRGDGRELEDDGLTNSSEDPCKNGLSLRNIDSCSGLEGNMSFWPLESNAAEGKWGDEMFVAGGELRSEMSTGKVSRVIRLSMIVRNQDPLRL